MQKRILGVILVFAALIGLGYFLFVRDAKSPSPTAQNQPGSPTATNPTIEPTIIDSLHAGGSSYLDPKGVYSFLYPNDYKLDMQNLDQHTRIYKIGATQQGQTELYDGVTMVFEAIALNGQSLEQWIDAHIKETTEDGTLKITAARTEYTGTKYRGLTYKARGLGEATYIVLQKDSKSPNAVLITFSVNDPQQKGYEKETDAVIKSLQLLK